MKNEQMKSREDMMVVLRRDETGKPTVWCDPDIADIVKALIEAGIETVASCSGHGYQPGSVILADGREVRVFTYEQARIIDKAFPDINGEVVPAVVDVEAMRRETELGSLRKFKHEVLPMLPVVIAALRVEATASKPQMVEMRRNEPAWLDMLANRLETALGQEHRT